MAVLRFVLTPPEIAKRWRCKPETVIAKIRSGELQAFNLAAAGSSRPRYRIPLTAIEAFERGEQKVVKESPVRRRKRDASVPQYV